MSKHTPGPWEVTKALLPGSEHADYFVTRGPAVSLLHMNGPCLMYSNAEADARLIAAAPELLAVLTHVERILPDTRSLDDTRDMIRAAIAKATEPAP